MVVVRTDRESTLALLAGEPALEEAGTVARRAEWPVLELRDGAARDVDYATVLER